MESITIKVDEKMAKEIEKAMDPLYATKTEFIREAIRTKLEEARRKRITEELRRNFGRGKTNTSDEELRRIREEAGNEFLKKHGFSE